MTGISTHDRAEAIVRAKKALAHLEQHPDTRQEQLGAARDQLNIAHNFNDRHAVLDAVYAIESIVLTVYGGIPAEA